ncbi:MAG: hypothetical protein PVH02_16875 [Desulfobacteraceae bacterium]|jgi:hypothetical protein
MSDFHLKLKEFYLNKPECVIDFPDWLLSEQMFDKYRAVSRMAIVEIAGRDSVAAAVKGVREESITDILPTYAYTGTEYGPWWIVEEAVERLSRALPEVRVHNLLILGSPGFWQALNGRFITELIAKCQFYVPCVGCHLYLHSVRIPLALMLGGVPIISGERERHNGRIKVNQLSEALDLYQGLAKEFGIELIFPLRHIAEGDRIADILEFDWPEGKEQLECVLSGNYRRVDGSVSATAMQIKGYLEQFALPFAREVIESYVGGHVPKHLEIAAQVLKNKWG